MVVVAVSTKCCVAEKERGVSHQLQGSYLEAVAQASLSYHPESVVEEEEVDMFPLKMEGPLVGEEGEDMAHQGGMGVALM